ncbi:MAG: hypothetical protein JXA21_24650 [Anaerolineae bacterium]|nr:hypothetical protein [Anaerolineae bacterium]
MKVFKRIPGVLTTGALFVALIALLVFYLYAVSDLPAQVYTESQRAFLDYNYRRSVSQSAPVLNYFSPMNEGAIGDKTTDQEMLPATLPWKSSRVKAVLLARYEEQGGVSVTTYDLDFQGEYSLVHSGAVSITLDLFFPFPNNLETLHDVYFLVDDEEPLGATYSTSGIHWQAFLMPGEEHQVTIRYKADGANSFAYGLMRDQRTDIDVVVEVIGLKGSTVSKEALPASLTEPTETGELWTWQYDALIADRNIRLDLPTRLSFAQRVAQLQRDFRTLAGMAPFLVVAFLVALSMMFHLAGVRLRLESYLLTGLGLALFYPLLTFLSGGVALVLASVISLCLVSGLLLVFLGLAVGWRPVIGRVGLLLVVFLGFFSLGMLTPWPGLMLTAGGLLLVAIFMLLYARRAVAPEPEPAALPSNENDGEASSGASTDSEMDAVTTPDVHTTTALPNSVPPSPRMHCPYCARSLETDYAFCPGCGHDTGGVRRCPNCGHQQVVLPDLSVTYCMQCGEKL